MAGPHIGVRISREAFACLHLAAEPFVIMWFELLYVDSFSEN
jgi:hypothetical protein